MSSTMASAGALGVGSQPGHAVFGEFGRVALKTQCALQRLAHCRLVVDHKNSHHQIPSGKMPSP